MKIVQHTWVATVKPSQSHQHWGNPFRLGPDSSLLKSSSGDVRRAVVLLTSVAPQTH